MAPSRSRSKIYRKKKAPNKNKGPAMARPRPLPTFPVIQRTYVYIVKFVEGWRSEENPLGKISSDILGVFKSATAANTFARTWLFENYPKQYAEAVEATLEDGVVSIDMETDKEAGIIFIDVEKWEVDGRSAWDF